MAVWQFSVVFLPDSWAKKNNYDSASLYDEEGYDTECAWQENQPDSSFKTELSKILPESKSWHQDLMFWGNTQEHDIQVWYENSKVEGIHVRLDVNQGIKDILVKVIRAANTLDCVLFFPEFRQIAQANEFELKSALKNSNAAKYVSDPQGFLNEISNET
jgi:hypothetical protein